jgi:hypothetical protein
MEKEVTLFGLTLGFMQIGSCYSERLLVHCDEIKLYAK